MVNRNTHHELPTIWEVPEPLWCIFWEILSKAYPAKRRGRRRCSFRLILNTVIYRIRSGIQWNHLPKELGDDSTTHRWFQRWCKDGIFERIWAVLIEQCEELGAVDWAWQAADGRMGKARFGGDKVGRNPTDRGKPGTKISVVTEAGGGPMGITVAGANIHDTKLLAQTLDAIVVARPQPTTEAPQHLCLDKGYDNPTGHTATEAAGYVPHIRRIGEEKLDANGDKNYPARRWVVERTLAWLSKCRAILVRYDKNWKNFLGCLQFACALLWFRRLHALKQF
jgi:putative transposase